MNTSPDIKKQLDALPIGLKTALVEVLNSGESNACLSRMSRLDDIMIVFARFMPKAPPPVDVIGLLDESVEKLEGYAKRQSRVRMGSRETGSGGNKHQTYIKPNPQEGQHYPAVQSLMDRLRQAVKTLKRR